jgi:hypothetical protein
MAAPTSSRARDAHRRACRRHARRRARERLHLNLNRNGRASGRAFKAVYDSGLGELVTVASVGEQTAALLARGRR